MIRRIIRFYLTYITLVVATALGWYFKVIFMGINTILYTTPEFVILLPDLRIPTGKFPSLLTTLLVSVLPIMKFLFTGFGSMS